MNNDIFVQAPQDPRLQVLSGDSKGVARVDAENPSEYKYGYAQHSQVGTLIPVASANGGIEGSRNPFGQIVAGSEYRKVKGRLAELPFQPTWLGSMIKGGPKRMPTAMPEPQEEISPERQLADARVRVDAAKRSKELAAQVARQREAEEALAARRSPLAVDDIRSAAEIPPPTGFLDLDGRQQAQAREADELVQAVNEVSQRQQAPAQEKRATSEMTTLLQIVQLMMANQNGGKVQTPTPAVAAAAMPMAPVPAVAVPLNSEMQPGAYGRPAPERVTMSGYFGTFRGNYMYLIETPDLVVLVYDTNSQVFTPPAKADVFQLSCKDRSFNVYFAGIEFELPFAACGIQVMVRSK